ncbi:MAG: TrkA family potassium uptake protein [Oscillospiraceae bacterium]|nr:TrkA family potassium uptake protein [Oscillospiraceae bacterium]
MSIHQSYAVFGLGRYGKAVAHGLVSSGADVLAVDINEDIVNAAVPGIPCCKCADTTDPEALRQLGIADIDVVIIAMANHLEESVMTAMLCKEMGVKTVIAKCASEMNCRILRKVGADRAVFPERESGVRLAKNLMSAGFLDIIELSGDVSILEIDVRPEWVGKSLLELELRKRHRLNVVAIVQNGKTQTDIDPEEPLAADMKLVVIANVEKMNRLLKGGLS